MFIGAYPIGGTQKLLFSGRLHNYSEILYKAGKTCNEKQSSLLGAFTNKSFMGHDQQMLKKEFIWPCSVYRRLP
jgi:hypothetical protein